MNKIIKIAKFSFAADAQIAISILKNEDIECYLKNEVLSQVFGMYAGQNYVWIEILEDNKQKAIEILTEAGYKNHLIEE